MSFTSKIKCVCILIALVAGTLGSMAQREKNYIYLFDCTGSMRTNGLWETAQTALDSNISLRASIPGSRFTVIPFGDTAYDPISFNNDEYFGKKQDMSKSFDNYIRQARYTNISDVLRSGFNKANPNKENEIYLFTDGIPNGTDSSKKVAQTILEWCAGHRNSKLFYVALTKGVINRDIKEAIDACPDASIVQCEDGIVPVITDTSTDVYTNLEELDNVVDLLFSIPGTYNLTHESTDELFDFSIVDNIASDGKIRIKLSPKGDLSIDRLHEILQGDEYVFQVNIQCADHRFVIVNPVVNVHVLDEVPSKLTISQGVDELQTDGVEWYDSFLWSDAMPEQKVSWDLTPIFKNELHGSSLSLKFNVADGQADDCQMWFNGQSISNGGMITIVPGQPAVLEVQFDHNATTGKRYFSLIPAAIAGIDIINDRPAEYYEGTSLRTDYNVVWNPLKTLFFWLAVVLLAVLVLWFIVLKQVFFPTIKMGKVTLTGPGTYYISKKIKGTRKVVLTPRRKSQNILSRIFTGEIKYVKADHFSPELAIIPAGGKKKVKLCSDNKPNNQWDIYPSTIFGQYDKGYLTNRTTNEKSEIEFT